MKGFVQSKTLWANALTLIATVFGLAGMDTGLTPEVQAQITLGGLAVVNFILRLLTDKGIEAKMIVPK